MPNGFSPLLMNVGGLTDDGERPEIIRLLHGAGADLEARFHDKGLTPLQHAAMRGKASCAQTLIQLGASVSATERAGATALHDAAFHGHTAVVRVLLAAGANPNLGDSQGNTPISLARMRGHSGILTMLEAAAQMV